MIKKITVTLILALLASSYALAFEYDPSVIDWEAVEEESNRQRIEDALDGVDLEAVLDGLNDSKPNFDASIDIISSRQSELEEFYESLEDIEDPRANLTVPDDIAPPDVEPDDIAPPDVEPDDIAPPDVTNEDPQDVQGDEPNDAAPPDVTNEYPACSNGLYGPQQFRCVGDLNFELEGYFCHPHVNDGYVHCTFLTEEDPQDVGGDEPNDVVDQPSRPGSGRRSDVDDDNNRRYERCSSSLRDYSEFYCESAASFSLSGYDCHVHGSDLHHCVQKEENVRRDNSRSRDFVQPSRPGSGRRSDIDNDNNRRYERCSSSLRDYSEFYCESAASFSLSGYDCHVHGSDLHHCVQKEENVRSSERERYVVNTNRRVEARVDSSSSTNRYVPCNSSLKGIEEFYCQASDFYLSDYDCHVHGSDLYHCKAKNRVAESAVSVISTNVRQSIPPVKVASSGSQPNAAPPEGCHYHGDFLHCAEDDVVLEDSDAQVEERVLVAPEGCEYFEGILYCNAPQSEESDEKEEVKTIEDKVAVENSNDEWVKYALVAVSTMLVMIIVYLLTRKNEK